MTRPVAQIGPERLPPLDPARYSPAQAEAAAALIATPRGALRGPFFPLLYSPELLNRVQSLGAFLRYSSSLPTRLCEFATIVTARVWLQAYEWQVHAPLARAAGVSVETLDALAEDGLLAESAADEQTIFAFCRQLHDNKVVDDDVYAAAVALLGEVGVVELTALCGYYAMLAMLLNVARTPCGGVAFGTPV